MLKERVSELLSNKNECGDSNWVAPAVYKRNQVGTCLGWAVVQLDWDERVARRCLPDMKIPPNTAIPDSIR